MNENLNYEPLHKTYFLPLKEQDGRLFYGEKEVYVGNNSSSDFVMLFDNPFEAYDCCNDKENRKIYLVTSNVNFYVKQPHYFVSEFNVRYALNNDDLAKFYKDEPYTPYIENNRLLIDLSKSLKSFLRGYSAIEPICLFNGNDYILCRHQGELKLLHKNRGFSINKTFVDYTFINSKLILLTTEDEEKWVFDLNEGNSITNIHTIDVVPTTNCYIVKFRNDYHRSLFAFENRIREITSLAYSIKRCTDNKVFKITYENLEFEYINYESGKRWFSKYAPNNVVGGTLDMKVQVMEQGKLVEKNIELT